jgi:hypothetical protein
MKHTAKKEDRPSPEEKREALKNICSSEQFNQTTVLCNILKHVVEKELTGQKDGFSGKEIAEAIKGSIDDEPSVRKNFENIRTRLKEYYKSNKGKSDPLRIIIPERSYTPIYKRKRLGTAARILRRVRSVSPVGDKRQTTGTGIAVGTSSDPQASQTIAVSTERPQLTPNFNDRIASADPTEAPSPEKIAPGLAAPSTISPQEEPQLAPAVPFQHETAGAPPKGMTVTVPNTAAVTHKPVGQSEGPLQVEPLPEPITEPIPEKAGIDILPDWLLKLLKMANWFRRQRMPRPVFKFVSLKIAPVVVAVVLVALCALIYLFRDEIKHYGKVVGIYTVAPPPVDLTSANIEDTYVPIVNAAWFSYRQDFGDVDIPDGQGGRKLAWTPVGVSRNQAIVNGHFKRLKESGVKALIWFLFADGATVNFDENGFVTGLDDTFIKDYLAALALAEKHGLGLIFVLVDHELMKLEKEQADGARLFGHAEVIEDKDKRRSFFENALLPLLQLAPVNRNIAGWIIVNEPEVALDRWDEKVKDNAKLDLQALKKGYVSEAGLSSFIAEAVQCIKQNTYRQPVSVGHRDLESLLDFQRQRPDTKLDFLVFHHYQNYMPPPVTHIRKQLGGADKRPIYIGEFNLNLSDPSKPRPISDARQFVGWARALGYAGLWPWALNPSSKEESHNEEKGHLRFQDIAGVSAWVEEHRRKPPGLDDCAWLAQVKNDIKWMEDEKGKWAGALEQHRKGIEDNQKWHKDTAERLPNERAEHEREQRELTRAIQVDQNNKAELNACLARIQNQQQLSNPDPEALKKELENKRKLEASVSGSEQYVKDATENLARREREIRKQELAFQISKQRLGAHSYLARKSELRAALANLLYLDYWRSEEKRLSPNCP